MTFIKTSILNGIAVVIKMLTLLGINKILAIYVGPSGYAAIGQFQNAVQMITTFASGAINTGVIKYTAEYQENAAQQRLIWQTAGTICLIGSLIAAIIICIFSKHLALWFIKDANYGSVFLWLAGTLLLFTFNTLLLAILNGKKEIGLYVAANISGSVFALIVTSVMSIKLGLYGALVSLAIYQSMSFFITLLICCRANWFSIKHLIGKVDKAVAINLSKYTAMALVSAICVPVSHILVRDHIGDILGWEAAGYWEAMWRLSTAYLLLITTTLSVYYLPRLSELKETAEIKSEIIQGYKIILPVAAACGLIIYLFRDFIISLLFTESFSPMRTLFAWQMIGDTLKIGSWILAYLMLGKAMTKPFIITEIIFATTFVILAYWLIEAMGLEGISFGYAINYAIYWMVLMHIIWRRLNKSVTSNTEVFGQQNENAGK